MKIKRSIILNDADLQKIVMALKLAEYYVQEHLGGRNSVDDEDTLNQARQALQSQGVHL